MKKFNFKVFLIALCTGAGSASMAGTVTGSFSDGDVLTASKMNEVSSAVNDNDSRVSSLESKLPGVDWATIDSKSITLPSLDLGGFLAGVDVGSVTLTAPGSGYVIVQFTGQACADVGDWVVLAASDISSTLVIGSRSVYIYGDGQSVVCKPFSHTQVYSVASAGDYTFYAVAGLDANKTNAGSGATDIYATLTAQYVPNRY